MAIAIDIDRARLEDFCRKWKITELALFGSVLRDDFGPDSDVDVLVSFEQGAPWSLLDFCEMKRQLEDMFGRPVDLVEKESLRNPYTRRHILATQEAFYVS